MLKPIYNRTYNVKVAIKNGIDFNQFIANLEDEFSILHGHQLIILDSKELTTEENEFGEYDMLSKIHLTCVHKDGVTKYHTYYICQSID